MINPFCYIGLHNWEYRKEKHKVVDHPHGRDTIRIRVRECKWCGHREHSCFNKSKSWTNFDDVSKDAIIQLKKNLL